MQFKACQDLVRFPTMVEDQGSLSVLEKSLLGYFIVLARPQLIVELGVFNAVTTLFILEFLKVNEIEAKVVGFDFPDEVAKLRESNITIRQQERDVNLQLIPGRLPESLETWLETSPTIDLALVDATHSYKSVTRELNLLWPRLSTEGYILCHDYSNKHEGVRYTVDRFAIRRNVMVLPLLSSNEAKQFGHRSVLVALCKRSHTPSIRGLIKHLWLSAKKDLLRYPIVEKIWRGLIKPLIRRSEK